jgi:hypothetical protein
MSSSRRKVKARTRVTVTAEELARAVAASYLRSPCPKTQGDVEHFWETRGGADREAYEKRAAQIFRMLTLPEGDAGHYMPRVRRVEG